MKHIFASGEEIYKKNVKSLEEGAFVVEYINYDAVAEGTIFEAVGILNDKPVSVEFKIKQESFSDVNFRAKVGIMMQSDLIIAEWESYTITAI